MVRKFSILLGLCIVASQQLVVASPLSSFLFFGDGVKISSTAIAEGENSVAVSGIVSRVLDEPQQKTVINQMNNRKVSVVASGAYISTEAVAKDGKKVCSGVLCVVSPGVNFAVPR